MAEQQALMAQQARQSAMNQVRAGQLLLEGAIDAEAYRVGPGDVFVIGIGGALAEQRRATVTADGILIIPEGGSFRVAGLTLAEARERVTTGLRRLYRNVALEVALAEPREFYVHVSGAVERPGRHAVVPIARVEDAVAEGMGGRSPILVLREMRSNWWRGRTLPALRNIEVRHADGSTRAVDLLMYYATGDLEHNPYLLDGDAVFVPAVERDGPRLVFIEHEQDGSTETVERLREGYDYREGDTLTDLLRVEGGSALLAQTDQARLLRADASGRLVSREIDVSAIRAGAAEDPALQPRDRILLPRSAVQRGTAAVVGYVRFPGSYPIIDGETTLRELVEAAGGLRAGGLLRGAYLERRGSGTSRTEREEEGLPDDAALMNPEQVQAQIERLTFERARLSDLDFTSRRYLAREVLGYPRVSLALEEGGALPDTPLRDGDRFVVPRDPQAVLVLGQVRYPGYVPFSPGADAAYYIAQAGGRGPAATETYVREADSGVLQRASTTPLRSGDMLFIDRAPIADSESLQSLTLQEQQLALQREQERRAGRFQIIQTSLAVLGTAVSVITTYLIFTADSN